MPDQRDMNILLAGIARGQAAVFYDGDAVLGSATITVTGSPPLSR